MKQVRHAPHLGDVCEVLIWIKTRQNSPKNADFGRWNDHILITLSKTMKQVRHAPHLGDVCEVLI